jgi:integrase
MLLSVFTRHTSDCKFKSDRTWRRCNCPKWIGGQVNKDYFRQSAGTRQWGEAEDLRLKLEEALAKGLPPFGPAPVEATALVAPPPAAPPPPEPVSVEVLSPAPKKPRTTVEAAVGGYLTDARSRGLGEDTLRKLETIFRKQFLAWCKIEGLVFLDEVDLDALLRFRGTWADAPLAGQKKQNRVIGFFWASMRRGYIKENPILGLGKIKVVHVPTDYFPRDEFKRIVDATYVYGDPRGGYIDIEDTRARLRALTLLMRWSGLRIRDAVTLEKTRLIGDDILLYQAKTGTPVFVPLPPYVADALRTLPPGPKPNPRYFFWSGNGLPKSAVADWQRAFRRLFERADIRKPDGERKRCHPHMFRDTFAVEMLLAGVPIDQVSILLGHASVKVTEKSYAPFVKARQVQLQESVRNAWLVGEPPETGPENNPPQAAGSDPRKAGWQLIRSPRRLEAGTETTGCAARNTFRDAAERAREPRPSSGRGPEKKSRATDR